MSTKPDEVDEMKDTARSIRLIGGVAAVVIAGILAYHGDANMAFWFLIAGFLVIM